MKHTPERPTYAADRTVKDIRRKTRKRYSSEDKIPSCRVKCFEEIQGHSIWSGAMVRC